MSDQEAQEEYKRFKAQTSDREYHLRHVLVETEAEAKEIISKLQAGTKFETLASRSKDKASAANGGDLGWSAPETFVKPFADAAVALTKGAYTRTPVKTQFGYHVIKLEDVRAAKVPAFEEMKPQIVQFLQRKKLQDYQSQLKQKARIE